MFLRTARPEAKSVLVPREGCRRQQGSGEFENRDFQYSQSSRFDIASAISLTPVVACIDETPRQQYDDAPPAAQKRWDRKVSRAAKTPRENNHSEGGQGQGRSTSQAAAEAATATAGGRSQGQVKSQMPAAGGGAAKAGAAGADMLAALVALRRRTRQVANARQGVSNKAIRHRVQSHRQRAGAIRQRMLERSPAGRYSGWQVAPGVAKGVPAKHAHGAKGAGVVPAGESSFPRYATIV